MEGGIVVEPWSARLLVERLGADEALARELVMLFLSEYPRMMAAIRDSVAAGEADDVRRAAHALKGSVANFTDGAPVRAALDLEMLGRDARLAEMPAVMATLERTMQEFVAQLEHFMRS